MYIKAYSEYMAYSGIFITVDIFSQFQARYSGITYEICFICVILGFNFEKLLPYLKSAPLKISQNAKFRVKIKIFKFGTKNALFRYFSD